MTPDQFDALLDEAWEPARSRGVIGRSAVEIRSHAAGFVPAAWRVRPPDRVVDLGSGAGAPGLHLAHLLGSTQVVLVDAMARRCEMAEVAVRAVGLGDRVSVVHARADEVAWRVGWREAFDGVVARLFGASSELAECGLGLLLVGGRMIVSVNDETGRWWEQAPLEDLGAIHEASWGTDEGSYLSVRRIGDFPSGRPRRTASRLRRPWPEG